MFTVEGKLNVVMLAVDREHQCHRLLLLQLLLMMMMTTTDGTSMCRR